jgi:hypothetical protein
LLVGERVDVRVAGGPPALWSGSLFLRHIDSASA